MPAWRPAKFWRVGGSLNPEFLQCIDRHQTICTALSAEPGKSACRPIPLRKARTYTNVGANAVNRPIVGACALAIYTELARIIYGTGGKNYARSELDQGLKAPAIQRQVFGKLAVHDSAYRGVGRIDDQCPCFHRHCLIDRPDLEFKVDRSHVLYVKFYPAFHDTFESVFVDRDAVDSWLERRDTIDSLVVGYSSGRNVSTEIGDQNGDARYTSAVWVRHESRDGSQFIGSIYCQARQADK